jgi:hypothetical protein
MTASNKTVATLLRVLERHVPRDKPYLILTQVRGEVDGNASFTETIDRCEIACETGTTRRRRVVPGANKMPRTTSFYRESALGPKAAVIR